jgi:hypothetical protein
MTTATTYIALSRIDEETWDGEDVNTIHPTDVFVASDDDEYPDPIDGRYVRCDSPDAAYAYAETIAAGRAIAWID